ncbi:hypothetical protein [Oceanobacillus caeni]|uniref:hypothetical protein n=1 Tax=Oceanobacillus caeni TaxID=405946 RepID=UPI002E241D63|nr:hypothetical protein [Oceanobacillus caeni]
MNTVKVQKVNLNSKDLAYLGIMVGVMLAFGVLAQNISFNLGGLVPGLTAAAALEGLRRARKAWKAGKGVKKALAVIFGWNVVGLIISFAGDAAIGYVLDHQINTLANW